MSLIHLICGSTSFKSITDLPFLSLGELRKNGICAEAILLPLMDPCKIEEKGERDKRESRSGV